MKFRRKKLTNTEILEILTNPAAQALIEEMKNWTVKTEGTEGNGNVTITIKI